MSELSLLKKGFEALTGAEEIAKSSRKMRASLNHDDWAARHQDELYNMDEQDVIDYVPDQLTEPDVPIMAPKYWEALNKEGFVVDRDVTTRQAMGVLQGVEELKGVFKDVGNKLPEGSLSLASSTRISPKNERTRQMFRESDLENRAFDGKMNPDNRPDGINTIRTLDDKPQSFIARVFQHEWFHDLDNSLWKTYRKKREGTTIHSTTPFISEESPDKLALRPGLKEAWEKLHARVVEGSPRFYLDAEELDALRADRLEAGADPDYYTLESEMMARAFDAYMVYKRGGERLVNNINLADISRFPSMEELKPMIPLFETFLRKLKPVKQKAPGTNQLKPGLAVGAGVAAGASGGGEQPPTL